MTKEEVLKNETATQNKLLADTTSLLFTNIDLFGKKLKIKKHKSGPTQAVSVAVTDWA